MIQTLCHDIAYVWYDYAAVEVEHIEGCTSLHLASQLFAAHATVFTGKEILDIAVLCSQQADVDIR